MKACGCLNKMAEGGRVEEPTWEELRAAVQPFFGSPSSGRRPEALNASRTVNMPAQTARGWAAGTLGLPGDLEGLGRLLIKGLGHIPTTGPLSSTLRALGNKDIDTTPALPTSDFYQEWLPGRDARPAGRFAGGLGSLAGGVGATTVARGVQKASAPVAKAALATIDAGMRGEGPLRHVVAPSAPAYAVKPRGGSWADGGLDLDRMLGFIPENAQNSPTHQWATKNLRNYITRDLGTAGDPLLALEREFPGLHLPEGALAAEQDGIRNMYSAREAGRRSPTLLSSQRNGPAAEGAKSATKHLNKHDELSGGAPLTPWGRVSDAEITSRSAIDDLTAELAHKWPVQNFAPEASDLGKLSEHTQSIMDRHTPVAGASSPSVVKLAEFRKSIADALANDWRAKKPDTPIYSYGSGRGDPLGFAHIVDYLDAATEPHRKIRKYLERRGAAETPAVAQLTPQSVLNDIRQNGQQALLPFHGDELQRWQQLMNAGVDLQPDALTRLSVPDAVRKTIMWNRMMADAADAAAMSGPLQKGWKEFKTYPDDPKGLRWVEFGKPDAQFTKDTLPPGYSLVQKRSGPSALTPNADYWDVMPESRDISPVGWSGNPGATPEDALGKFSAWHNTQANDLRGGLAAEGEHMGHCVGGYCDDVLQRGTKIYSLRDAKGKPHVTVETRPARENSKERAYIGFLDSRNPDHEGYQRWLGQKLAEDASYRNKPGLDAANEYLSSIGKAPIVPAPLADEIVQIKGKGNAAPTADYLPHVQDFVRSGKWGQVGDLRNTGLLQWTNESIAPKGYYTPAELEAAAVKGGMDPEAARILREGNSLRGYAHGGSVKAALKDPEGFLPRNIEELTEWLEHLYAAAAEL